MKRKSPILLLIPALLLSFVLAGCGTKPYDYYSEDLSKFLTLGEYKNITVEVENIAEITDEDVQAQVNALLDKHLTDIEITDKAAEDGDKVNIDYTGKLDGVAFDGGTDTGAELTLGSDSFIEGFEDGLIGITPGSTVDLNLTFPDPYENNPDLAGKAVVFTVTLNYIYGTERPEYTDAFVEENTDYTTIEEYEAALLANLQTTREENLKINKLNAVWQQILSNATITSYPQKRIDQYVDDAISYYNEYAVYYNVSYEDFLANYVGTTEEDFLVKLNDMAKETSGEELVFYSIVKAESYSITDEEYETGLANYVEKYSDYYSSAEEFLDAYNEEDVRDALLWDKVIAELANMATITWVEPTEDTTEDTADTTENTADDTAGETTSENTSQATDETTSDVAA